MLSERDQQNPVSLCMYKRLCMQALPGAGEMPKQISYVLESHTLLSTMRHQRRGIRCQILRRALGILNLEYSRREPFQISETMSQNRAEKDNLL